MRNTPPRVMLSAMLTRRRGSLATCGCFSNKLATNGNTSVFITRINRVRAERYILIQELAVGTRGRGRMRGGEEGTPPTQRLHSAWMTLLGGERNQTDFTRRTLGIRLCPSRRSFPSIFPLSPPTVPQSAQHSQTIASFFLLPA